MEWWGWLLVWIALQPVFAVIWAGIKAPQRRLEGMGIGGGPARAGGLEDVA